MFIDTSMIISSGAIFLALMVFSFFAGMQYQYAVYSKTQESLYMNTCYMREYVLCMKDLFPILVDAESFINEKSFYHMSYHRANMIKKYHMEIVNATRYNPVEQIKTTKHLT